LRRTIDCLPVATREAMLAGVRAGERIIVGAYVDGRGGVCPMLAAHRRGARTNFLSFARAWDRFTPTLIASGAAHGVLIGVLVYLTIANMLAPYANVRIVSHAYRPFSSDQVTELYARSRPITQPKPTDQVLSLEELRERERKRLEERERRRAEEEARLKAEREKAEREAKAAEEKAKAEEAAKAANPDGQPKFGEINEAAIKDLVGKIYKRYQAGEIELNNFSVTVTFRIDCDGSIPRSSINIPPKMSSGDPKKDEMAKELLWLIGESHALGPLCKLSSNSIRFDLSEDTTSLSITGFGPNPEWAAQEAKTLRTMFWTLATFKGKTDTGELAKYIKVNTANNRISVDLSLSRARASEMMRARFAGNPQ